MTPDYEVAEEGPSRPTPDEIDQAAREYLNAKTAADLAAKAAKTIEDRLVNLVNGWGAVPAGAEKSRRLNGRLSEMTLTRSDTITVITDRVEDLRAALEANERGEFFARLFARQPVKYDLVSGADDAMKEEYVGKRLAQKVLSLYARCFTVKPKKPSLKVTIADPAKPAKKSRAKEDGK